MDTQQTSTDVKKASEVKANSVDPRYQALIDFKALGGLISDEEGSIKKQTMGWLADMVEVDRTTLYLWMKKDGFWQAVNQRRNELSAGPRLAKMHEVWYLSGLKPGADGFRDRQLWLANFDPNFRMPTEKVEHEAGNSWAALLDAKRKNRQDNAIEGEVVDESSAA